MIFKSEVPQGLNSDISSVWVCFRESDKLQKWYFSDIQVISIIHIGTAGDKEMTIPKSVFQLLILLRSA